MKYPVTVVGAGPGSSKYLPPIARQAVMEADLLVGGESALSLFEGAGKEKKQIKGDLQKILDYVAEVRETKRVAVLLSGDPGFFSLLPRLKEYFGEENLQVIPGISSLQLACARLGLYWHDMAVASVHGRGLEQLERVRSADKIAVLTDERCTPGEVCRYFLEQGRSFNLVWVLTNIGRSREEITLTGLKEGAEIDGRGNSIVILLRKKYLPSVSGAGEETALCAPDSKRSRQGSLGEEERIAEGAVGEWRGVVTPGLDNELFARGKTPLSQQEARALLLCKARLRRGMTVYDLGAGTGGWTVEAARLIAPGRVYAAERDAAAAGLIRQNLKKFGLNNALVAVGEAPEVCADFPPADCVLVGGSGGRLQEILRSAPSWLRPGGAIVLSAVTPDTFSEAWQMLQEDSWEQVETVLLQVSRLAARGGARFFQGENPVFILRAVRREECDG